MCGKTEHDDTKREKEGRKDLNLGVQRFCLVRRKFGKSSFMHSPRTVLFDYGNSAKRLALVSCD